jgi:quercetin dioxygenase-like cupin family protein
MSYKTVSIYQSMDQFTQARWADYDAACGRLISFAGEQPLRMQHSDGTARPLVVDRSRPNAFGADIVRFEAGKGVGLHVHVGAHILMVTQGKGVLTYNGEKYDLFPGMIYLVPSNVPHAIEALTELVLVAIGNDHRPADSEERLDVVV